MLNIYCDESCHLENDNSKVMGIAGISCPDYAKESIYNDIKSIKQEFNINIHREIKWNKVSKGKIDYYKKLVNYFFDNDLLRFRGVILPDKQNLNHNKYNQTHDIFYYKMYYYVISYFLVESDNINVYIDIKDTCSQNKVDKLKEVLDNKSKYQDNSIKKIQQIRSHENSILQLTDLILGAIIYRNRNLNTSSAKMEICDLIEKKSGSNLKETSYLRNSKFNLLIFDRFRKDWYELLPTIRRNQDA